MEKIKSVLEKAATRIGCPPGDNADADLYHEIIAALSELEGSKPKEPPRYVMSRDYDAAYERVCNGDHLFGEVDYNRRDGGAQMRDVVRVRRMKHGDIDIGVRGCGYGGVSNYDIKEHGSERAAFKWLCEAINLEWIAVEPPKEQGAEPVATALIHEHSKPSLMVGFSEEEMHYLFMGWLAENHEANETKDESDLMRDAFLAALHYANTRAVSIDRLVEAVREWLTHDGREPDNPRQQPMPMSDLRERLMKMAALP